MKDPGIQLWAEDEVHFQRHSTIMRMWSPKGRQPRVISASTRQKVGFFGAINVKTGEVVAQKAPGFNSDTLGEFLSYLLERTEGKLLLILDNATWHRARDLNKFFFENRNRLVRVFLHRTPRNSIPLKECGELPRQPSKQIDKNWDLACVLFFTTLQVESKYYCRIRTTIRLSTSLYFGVNWAGRP